MTEEAVQELWMLEGQLLFDEAELGWVAPGEAQHLGEVVEGDGAPQVVLEINKVGGAPPNFLA